MWGRLLRDQPRACQIGDGLPQWLYRRCPMPYPHGSGVPSTARSALKETDAMASNQDTLVTIFGGSGFLGRAVVRALAKREYRLRVAVRRPELAGHLQPLGRVGQIHAVQANVRYPASVEAAMRDSHVAVNLVGILAKSGAQTFDAVQVRGAETIAKAAAAAGASMVHVSAIGANDRSSSQYARTKADGEKAVLAALPSVTIMWP